jgi:hypothetical protein
MTVCEALHQWANSQPVLRFPFDDASIPLLHRRHPRQAAGRAGRAEEGRCHRGAQRLGPAALVEAAGVAAAPPSGQFSLRYETEFIHG